MNWRDIYRRYEAGVWAVPLALLPSFLVSAAFGQPSCLEPLIEIVIVHVTSSLVLLGSYEVWRSLAVRLFALGTPVRQLFSFVAPGPRQPGFPVNGTEPEVTPVPQFYLVYEFERVFCTGIGIAELINLPLLVFCRYLFSWEALYQVVQYVYFLVYLLEDLVPSGRPGYHLMIVARKQGMSP